MFMFYALFLIATFKAVKTTSDIDEKTKNGLLTAKSLDEFKKFAVLRNTTSLMADFNRNEQNISKACDLEDTCILIPVCVPIEPGEVDVPYYFPRCVKLARCVNSTHDHSKHCYPIINPITVTIMQFVHVENGEGDRIPKPLTKDNHTSCSHESKFSPPPSLTPLRDPITIRNHELERVSNCSSHDQCDGNVSGDKPQSRDDCNEYERYDSDCCSCICRCSSVGTEGCSCPDGN